MLLGVDIGGTFTDFVYHDGNSLRIHKVLSTPDAPERAIFEGIKAMGIVFENLRVIHGTTVATNAILEGKGAKTVYITNHGLKDVLTIGRQARRELYNLQPQTVEPPVADGYCLETGGRLGPDGSIIEDLTEDDIDTLLAKVKTLDVQAAAINLLFSYLDDRFECMIEEALFDYLYISRSSKILPEYREYERGITTWLNAYVGPLVKGYLYRLENQLIPASLSVMRSSGNTCSVNQAGDEAVHLLLSGPAGGLSGAQYVANAAGHNRLLTLDMGGTSTDVALVDGSINLTGKGYIDRYLPAMHTVANCQQSLKLIWYLAICHEPRYLVGICHLISIGRRMPSSPS
jgi:N-methylhydantoinase A